MPLNRGFRDGPDAQKRARLARKRLQEQPYDYDKLTQATTQLKQVHPLACNIISSNIEGKMN
jgi:hypothetical protein